MVSDTQNPDADTGLEGFLCFALYSANHAMNRVYKPLLEKLGLTYPQYLAMVVLWARDDQTVGELCEKLFLESSTMTPLLKRLEKMGLVYRQRDPADERQVRISLTVEGRGMQKRTHRIPDCVLTASGLTGKALLHLNDQITTLRENLSSAAAE
jgi:DNA-binding MarR family transcriptional regulator